MVDSTIVQSVSNYLHTLASQGFPVSFGLVYGSQVNGNTHEWSDIDVIVVSPLFDGEIDHENIFKLWRVAARTDNRIEPIPCGERQWREDDASPLVEIARKEGVIVYPDIEAIRQAG
jgi:uncharacterized protein